MTFEEAYADWPHEVTIETFAKCNAACVFCPYPTLERQGAKMSDAMIDSIIEQLKEHPWPFMISPFKVNEPFLDKRLIPVCRKINRELPNAHLRLFSNGSALTNKHIREVAGLERVVHLWISLNEHRARQYRETMALDFGRTAANLDQLHAMIELDEFPHKVVVSKVMGGGSGTEIDIEFREYVADRWPLFSTQLLKRDSWLGFIEPNDRPVPDAPCSRWHELNITAEGIVSLCCMDGRAQYPIGDLNKQTVYEVYNSPEYRARRIGQVSRKTVPVCESCNY
jgi:hypothetical protein